MLREATEKDLQEILEIYNYAILNTTAVYTYKAQSMEERKSWFLEKKEKGYPVFVFEENDQVLGFATYGPFRAWPAYKYTIEHSVYVKNGYWGRGIGRMLMQEIIRHASQKGYATLVAGIDSKNEVSIKIHEKFGFNYTGTIKRAGYKFGAWLDLVFYQLMLPGPENPEEG